MDISACSPTCGPYPRIPSSPNPTRTRRPGNTTPPEIADTEMPLNLSTTKLNCGIPTGGQQASHDITCEHAPLLGANLRNPHAAPDQIIELATLPIEKPRGAAPPATKLVLGAGLLSVLAAA
eukprot:UN4002